MKKLYLLVLVLACFLCTSSVLATDLPATFDVLLTGETVLFEQGTDLAVTISKTNVTCNGDDNGSVDATPTGGSSPYSYAWSNNADTKSIQGLAPGDYTVTVTDAADCTITATTTVTEPSEISVTLTKLSDVSCSGGEDGSADINASGGTGNYSYAWSHDPTITTSSTDNLPTGTHTVTVTDANDCTNTAQITISGPAMLSCSITENQDVSCQGDMDGSATASVTGGTMPYSFEWSHSMAANSATANDLPAGTHLVTINDVNGCSVECNVTITEPDALVLSGMVTHESGNDAIDGSITTTVTGGTGPYSYSWDNGEMTSSITDLAPGTYSVTVSDANGCQANASFTIDEFGCAVSLSLSTQDVSCHGDSTGQINLVLMGETPPTSISWSNGETTETINGLVAGSYTVTVTDGANCTISDSVSIGQPDLIDIEIDTVGGDIGGGTGFINISVTGGTPPYSYGWSDGNIAQNLLDALAGSYNVTVTDAENCMAISDSVEVQMATDLLETSIGDAVQIFPNPASDYIKVHQLGAGDISNSIELYSMDGGKAVVRTVQNGRIWIADIPTGLYLLRLQVDSRFYFTRVLILRE
ncbi:MAG: T9SS type A sorting domain-containing protein [Saprospiraceae bacterium]|nr:T9SS type A sorting domain-containing protein [Saprospiraceae bacterium]